MFKLHFIFLGDRVRTSGGLETAVTVVKSFGI